MSVITRSVLAVVAAFAVALSGVAVAPDSAVAAQHHHKHKKHKHKKHKHKKKRPVASTTRPQACPTFPANNWWNRDISRLPVDARSTTWLSHMTSARTLWPDFGLQYGIPVTTVTSTHPRVPVSFTYATESDRVGYPFGPDTRIEGGRDSAGDKHAVVVDWGACRLWETWNTTENDGTWRAGAGATWSLRSNALRPETWTAADAAGLPIYPGLLKYDEVARGRVTHAIRFTTDAISRAHLWPARHDDGPGTCSACPPLGARFRLRADFDTSSYGPQARVVLQAMKTYGLVLADVGAPWFFQGAQDWRWQMSMLNDLKRIPTSAFVAVDTSSLRISPDSGATR